MPVVGSTEEEARRKDRELNALIKPELAIAYLSIWIGIDATTLPPDEPLPELPITEGGQSRQRMLLDLARREKLTVRQLAMRNAEATSHRKLTGTPHQICDHLEGWFDAGGADGFCLIPGVIPGDLDDFIAHVIPELQRRGRFRTRYESTTLRGNLGLSFPAATPRMPQN